MNVRIDESWRKRLQEEFDKPYFEQLVTFVKNEYKQAHVLPPGPQIFHIFNACPFEKVKVVILGQDPYPNPGQYYGVCFSVPEGVAIPGSLMNIFKEIHDDLGKPIPSSGNLDRWVSQGVFPMNSHSPCPPNRFAPEQRMGNIHGCHYQEIKRRTGKSSIHVMGQLR
jgi:uracil-DNA glycosylase